MKSLSKKEKNITIVLIVILAIIGLYLNRSYAYIYDKIGAADLPSLNPVGDYLISNNMAASTSLVYVALGDSLSAGAGTAKPEEYLPYLLAQKLAETDKKVNLKNYSVPGYQSSDLLSELLPAAISANPDVVTLLIGVNDIHNQVSATDFRQNYYILLKRLSLETKAKIYVVNLPFIGADTLMLPPYQTYFDRQTREFNKIIEELAGQYRVVYVDLYTPSVTLFKQAGEHYSADLFHPSAAGYQIWADIIYDYFRN